jgi:Ca2+-binding RTX toxin-like protein
MGTYGPKATSAPTGAIILHPGDNISALMSAAPTGTTFYFEPGVYRGVSFAPKDGQAFIGAEGAILSGSAVRSNWTQSGNLWVIGGQTQQGRVHPNAEFEPGTQRPGYPETVFLDNTPLKPVDALSKVVPGTFYFDYAADKIYIADNPTGHTIEAGKLTDAFHGSATNVTVQNLVIEKYDPQIQDGAIQGGRGWTIQNNEVRLNYAVGIIGVDGSKLIGNYVHDNGQMGLGGFGDNILVQGNEIAKNGDWSGIDVLWEGGGFKFANTDNLVVRGNYSHDNNGTGMWTDIDNIHTLYEDNVVVHNGTGGISHEISYDAIIRNNTLIGNGADDPRSWWWGNEIQIQNSQNVEVYGNRVEMTGGGNGIVMIQQNRGSGTFGTYTTTGNQIHDNIIVDHDGEGYIGGVADYNQSGMLSGGNIWRNNQYFMSDGEDRFQWGGSKTFTQFKGAAHETGSISQSYPDTSGWLTASPADAAPSPPADPAQPPPADTSRPSTPTLNEITGTSGDDSITGLRGNDKLSGNDGADLIIGGAGRDTLSGGAGDDRFVFSSISHSKIGAPDLIQDFQSGDVIDLSQIDAHAGLSGDQAFKWIGSNSFSNQAGELRTYFDGTNIIVEANVNGDAAADFEILVNGKITLSAVDFLL